MAQKTPTKRGAASVGKDAYRVLGLDGVELAIKGAAPLALVVAQKLAMDAKPGAVLTVVRDSLFGPTSRLYRVVRDERGVSTITLSNED